MSITIPRQNSKNKIGKAKKKLKIKNCMISNLHKQQLQQKDKNEKETLDNDTVLHQKENKNVMKIEIYGKGS